MSRTDSQPLSTSATAEFSPSQAVAGRVITLITLVVVGAAILGMFASGANYVENDFGIADGGALVAWLAPLLGAGVFVASMVTVGLLVFAGFLDPGMSKTTVSGQGRRMLVWASVASGVWCLLSFAAAGVTLANILGVDLGTALTPRVISLYALDVEDVRTLIFSAVLAGVVCIGAALSVALTRVSLWLALALLAVAAPATAGHASGLGDHSLAIVASVTHAITASLWLGGVLALGIAIWRGGAQIAIATRRFSKIATTALVLLAASGVLNAYVRLAEPSDLFTSGYGRLVVAKTVLLIAVIAVAIYLRRRLLPTISAANRALPFLRVVLIEAAIMACAAGLGVALTQTAPTRIPTEFATQGELLLGAPFPPPPTLNNVMLSFDLDLLFLLVSIAAIGYYLIGVRRLHRRGDSWPAVQTVSWIIGWLIVMWATNSGISTYSEVSVGLHMVQHMTLSMLAPIFIVLAAPITLALRSLKPSPDHGRGPREVLTTSLHSKIAIFVTNPIFIILIYVVGLYGLYLTDLFGSLMRSHVGHIFMTCHFLASGLLLAYVAIGVDPKPRPLPYWGRMLLVLTTIVLHTFFALALMSATSVIGANWYSLVRPPWLTDPVKDSVLGGQIAWGVAEIPTVLMMLIIAVQWYRSDTRESKRRDRRTQRQDLELDDYNRYLQALNERAERDAAERFSKRGSAKGAKDNAAED